MEFLSISSTAVPSAGDWFAHQALLFQLYFGELPLSELIETMETKHGFTAT